MHGMSCVFVWAHMGKVMRGCMTITQSMPIWWQCLHGACFAQAPSGWRLRCPAHRFGSIHPDVFRSDPTAECITYQCFGDAQMPLNTPTNMFERKQGPEV